MHQRHAISEDTWNQVLEFSRSVHEDLGNYDPEGEFSFMRHYILGNFTLKDLYAIASVHNKKKLKNCYCTCAGAWPVLVDEFVDNMYRYATFLAL